MPISYLGSAPIETLPSKRHRTRDQGESPSISVLDFIPKPTAEDFYPSDAQLGRNKRPNWITVVVENLSTLPSTAVTEVPALVLRHVRAPRWVMVETIPDAVLLEFGGIKQRRIVRRMYSTLAKALYRLFI